MNKYLLNKFNFLSSKYDFNLGFLLLSILVPLGFLLILKTGMYLSSQLDSNLNINESDLVEINANIKYDQFCWNCTKGGRGRILKFNGYESCFYIPCHLRDFFIENKKNSLIFDSKSYFTFKILKTDYPQNSTENNNGIDIYELKSGNITFYDLKIYKYELLNRYQLNKFWYTVAILICIVLNYFAFKQY